MTIIQRVRQLIRIERVKEQEGLTAEPSELLDKLEDMLNEIQMDTPEGPHSS